MFLCFVLSLRPWGEAGVDTGGGGRSGDPLEIVVVLMLLKLLTCGRRLFSKGLLRGVPAVRDGRRGPRVLASPRRSNTLRVPVVRSDANNRVLGHGKCALSCGTSCGAPR